MNPFNMPRELAVKSTATNDPYLCDRLGNLVSSLEDRCDRFGSVDDLNEAIQIGQLA